MKRLFLLIVATGVFLISRQFVYAEITVPYTVDEKVQVLFGDSTAVSDYEGLQNYVQNYVNNYLHITFTYTHHGCCTASYPPSLYVTDRDPRATTTQAVKDSYSVYTLSPQPTHLTDWYAYDVQFDATGYTAVVKQATTTEIANFHRDIAGLTNNDWAALANLYPKQDPATAFSMAFTPLEIYDSPDVSVATTTPVIIVPGIMGTELLEDNPVDNLIWPNTIQIVTSISDDFLDFLKMDINGNSVNINVIKGDILKTLNGTDYFEGLFNKLSLSGYEENVELFGNPYDWRLDILKIASDTEANETLSLKEKIEQIKTQTGMTKVNLVAHSMGGLIVKKYLKDYGGNSVDKFIDIGTPHTGSPSAYKILMYGDNLGVSKFLGLINVNANRIKSISQNMPSIYELLPSQKYFDDSDSNYKYYVFNGVNGNERLTYNQSVDYLKAEGRNGALVDRADAFHQEIDNLDPATYGVDTYNIVGCGTPTIGQFYILDNTDGHTIYNIKMINGDGTVPLKSAEAMTAQKTYYVKNAQHAVMPSTTGVKELVAEILTSTSTEDFDISPYSNLAMSADGCQIPDGRIVSFHSPIELHIYDSSGNHVGPNTDGDIENNISGVVYEIIDDNKFAFLPNGVEYTIKGNATAVGTFDTRIQEIVNGEVATTIVFADIPLSLTTHAQFALGSIMPTEIALDSNNDGIFESNQAASVTILGILESTGKTHTVPIVVAQSSSKPVEMEMVDKPEQVFVVEPVQLISTSTSIVRSIVKTSKKEVIFIPKSVKEPKYENTAIAYKSSPYSLKTILGKCWSWIKSKL